MTEFKPFQFGKYTLLDRIATGGMAELYRAKITSVQGFEKLVAIKKILPHLSGEESLVTSFIEEAKLAAFLQHPNIVQIYDFGSMEEQYFLAMEYLLGRDLKYITQKSKQSGKWFRLEDSLYITSQVCRGLNYAHTLKDFHGKPLKIIHRDIGPQNVFITYDGQVKIIDFGIAKAANQNTRTQSDLIKGKIAYMSPEQARGEEIDHRSDIFSVGIVLYELVTRKRMFSGDTYHIYPRVCRADFEPPERVEKNLPSLLYDILHKALAGKRAQRYQSADEMAADLELCISALSGRPGSGTISKYVKTLLRKEAAAEQRAMRQAESQILGQPVHARTTRNEKTQAIDTTAFARSRITGRTFALVLILGIVLFFFIHTAERPGEIFCQGKNIVLHLFAQDRVEATGMTKTISQTYTADRHSPDHAGPGKNVAPGVIPDPPELEMSRKLVREKRYSAAIRLLKEILAKQPSLKARAAAPYAQALNGLAAKIASDDPKKAKDLLFRSLEMNPENTAAHYLLGRLYTKEKDYRSAAASYNRAIALGTDIPGVYFNLGYIYYAIDRDYPRAEEMYERTVELSPPFLDEAFFNLAVVQKKLGKKQESISNLERAVRFNANNSQARKLLERLTRDGNKTG